MNIEVRYLDRTRINLDGLLSVVEEYGKDLSHDILIVFDKRLKECYGQHTYSHEKQLHTIRISPRHNKVLESKTGNAVKVSRNIEVHHILCKNLDEGSETHNVISTILHEICHAIQREKMKHAFFKKDFSVAKGVKNKEMADLFSECELEARVFENTHLIDAMKLYNSSCY